MHPINTHVIAHIPHYELGVEEEADTHASDIHNLQEQAWLVFDIPYKTSEPN